MIDVTRKLKKVRTKEGTMKVSKCCKVRVLEYITEAQKTSPRCWVYKYGFFCSKCQRPCEVIDLPDKEREE